MQGPQEKSAGLLPLYLWGHEGEDKESKHKESKHKFLCFFFFFFLRRKQARAQDPEIMT